MINVIQHLEKNPELVALLKEQKASLIGISAIEQKAILDSFEEKVCLENGFWN
ncbi:competence pheromone ComX [Lysinibacillus agricola]|uniref:ComX pheromone n=1 Tax=Lysinibacillus agricola TaxID=2590012 RepID=A0ABX7AQ91_9BACI|nr:MULTISPECIES: competence pheromone ComX [Lysinibacillus]KOS63301.1 competence protein ComX [Lysinibacillus sp. FJAT-14222]QQP12133.1 competence pheromone ComX [Lysinibacillus agricola]